jgi:hypothetical protein
MANGPFDRTILNPREKPLSSDINQAESQLDRSLRFFVETLFADGDTGALRDGFINRSLLVEATSPTSLSVVVRRGLGFQIDASAAANAIGGVVGLDDLSSYKPVPLLADATFTVPAAPTAPDTRIDIIEVKASALATDPSTRQVLNITSGAFEPGVVNKILTWLLDSRVATVVSPANSTQPLSYKQGVAANPGTLPPTTVGYIKLCEIAVGSDVTFIAAADLTDSRVRFTLPRSFRTVRFPITQGVAISGSPTISSSGFVTAAAPGDSWMAPLPHLDDGEEIVAARVYVNKFDGSGTMDARLIANEHNQSARFTLFSSVTTIGAQVITIDETQDSTITFPYRPRVGDSMHVQVDFIDAGDDFVSCELDLQRI